MSTNQTKNLKLHSWAPLDRFTREEFNANWAGIDAAWGDLDGRLIAEVEARSTTAAALATETSERKAADTTLQKNIDAKATAAALATETAERKAADTTLQKNIDAKANAAALTTETSERKAADTTLQTNIDAKANASALTTETSERKAADAALQTAVNGKVSMVIGTYGGTYDLVTHPATSAEGTKQEIKLGFRPKAVFVRAKDEYETGTPYYKYFDFTFDAGLATTYRSEPDLAITNTGFTVYDYGSCRLNVKGQTYLYLALY